MTNTVVQTSRVVYKADTTNTIDSRANNFTDNPDNVNITDTMIGHNKRCAYRQDQVDLMAFQLCQVTTELQMDFKF